MELTEIKQKILDLLSHQDLTKKQIMSALWLSERKVTLVLQELQAENLVHYANKVYSMTNVPKKESAPRKKPKEHKSTWTINLLRSIFGVLSVGGSAVSIRNTSVYLTTVFPMGWAFALSGLMSLFMISAFSAVVVFWKKGQKTLAIGLGILFIIVTTFSMTSTTVGMYNAQKDSFVHKSVVTRQNSNNSVLYAQYEKQERDIQGLIDARQVTLDRYNKLIEPYTDTTSKDYKTLSWNIYTAEKYIADRVQELNGISEKKGLLIEKIESTDVVAEDFYEMIQRLFGIQASLVQFLLSVMVCIFVDVISPIGGAMALFLREDK